MLPPPDISVAYVDDKMRPSKDFYNWIKSFYDTVRGVGIGGTIVDAANDAAAAAAGVPIGSVYRNGSVLMVRIV